MKRRSILRFSAPAPVLVALRAGLALLLAARATVLGQAQRRAVDRGPRQLPAVRQAPRTPGTPLPSSPSRALAPPAQRTAAAATQNEGDARPDEPLPPGGVRGKVGQNVSGLSDYDRQMVYINAAKTMRPFGSVA